MLALASVPSYTPEDRRNLTGAQLRNRALTDTFEPGSTMKPITVALALETRRVRPTTVLDTASGRFTIDGSTISDTHPQGGPHGGPGHPEVQQRGHGQDGLDDAAPRNVGNVLGRGPGQNLG